MKRFVEVKSMRMAAFSFLITTMSALFIFCGPDSGAAGDSLCAVVKIEIQQELTLERQAFDAHMRINNGLSHLALENVTVSISFTNDEGNPVLATSDPDETTASFYFRENSKTNISDVNGDGTVAPSTSADIHWLIVPSPGASNGLNKGKLYFIGATLTYTLGGEVQETVVSPDSILVKPMPQMVLDYFLPTEVYGDDAFTDAIEPPIPFTLGVRVKNNGRGTARDLKIESAQPKITENEQGLLIGFSIEKSQVNGGPVGKTLLADFGDIDPGNASVARWWMTCSLSGRFVSFEADFSHSDELGGALTSLIDSVHTHFLVRNVQVDLPGRDAIEDFLAKDGDLYRVYESDGLDTKVDNPSEFSALAPAGVKNGFPVYSLTTPANQGYVHIQLADPFQGKKIIHSAIRSDGKVIKAQNIWLSKSRQEKSWNHFIHLFDAGTTGQYTILFEEPAAEPKAPVLQFIPDLIAVEGEHISFLLQASDPDGTVPRLFADTLPVGASIQDHGDGTAMFDWIPAIGQAGTYTLTFKASDGVVEDARRVSMVIRSITDTDGDGMNDRWEMEQFGTLVRDGSGDFDQDHRSDLEEFLSGSDPTTVDHAPTVPEILSPAPGDSVYTLAPILEIQNSTDPDEDPLFYAFELYADELLTDLVFASHDVPETATSTAWPIPTDLIENGHYFWRVRATDGYSFSQWAYGDFFVNATDDPPVVCSAVFPPDGSEVDSLSPVLQVSGASDPDREALTCTFAVYDEISMSTLISKSKEISVSDNGTVNWQLDTSLSDGVTYFWCGTVTDAQGLETNSTTAAFTVNTTNHTPTAPAIIFPDNEQEVKEANLTLTVGNALDLDGDALFYRFEIDTAPTFDSVDKRTSILLNEGIATTSWHGLDLEENTTYFWRSRSTDRAAHSPWSGGNFFVNRNNDPPRSPVLMNPGHDAWVGKRTPALSVTEGVDPDRDTLSYRFEVYSEPGLENLIAWGETFSPTWTVSTELADRTHYYWRARLIDEHGAEGVWMDVASFFVSKVEVPSTDEIRVDVLTDQGETLQNIRVYAFTDAGSYAGVHTKTGPEGSAMFDIDALLPGVYRFRADYMGSRFWSEAVAIPETAVLSIIIEEEAVTVTADTALGAVAGVRVHLFSESGRYLGLTMKTGASGQATLSLPVGQTFLFRTDILGNRYWSDKTTVRSDTANLVAVNAGGGTLQFVTARDDATPMSNLKTHLFHAKGNYLGVTQKTNALGVADFKVTEGEYKVRVDYLGNKFWSDRFYVAADTFKEVVIDHQPILLTLQGSFQGIVDPLAGFKTYLFTSGGSYLGKMERTNAKGHAIFDLPEREFKIRADVLGGRFWSEPFIWGTPVMTVPMAEAKVSVYGCGHPIEGARVYVFSPSGTYLGIHGNTDAEGLVSFRLPARTYAFRADYQGNRFWSRGNDLAPDEYTDVGISVGGGTFRWLVQNDVSSPIAGLQCHVFSQKKVYLGLTGVTDEQGEVGFDLSEGTFHLRVDYLGNQFWQENVWIVDDVNSTLVIAHQPVSITAMGNYQGTETPLANDPVHLFSPAGAYLGITRRTDELGKVTLDLPEKPYLVRVDFLGNRYWSAPFMWQDSTVWVDQGRAVLTVTQSGAAAGNAKVYLFNETGRYLGLYEVTDADGKAVFTLPEGKYQFRSNVNGDQQWTEITDIEAHTESCIEITMDETVVQ